MIKKIKWKNYRSLGNLELDFTKTDGTIYKTIVFAGDNGTGKTTILDTLASFLNYKEITPFERIEYEINDETYLITNEPPYGMDSINIYGTHAEENGFHYRKKLPDGPANYVQTNRVFNSDNLKTDTEDIRYYGFAYSRAKTGFKTLPIKSSSTETIDSDKFVDDFDEDYTTIKQLLVDINSQDNSDWANYCRTAQGNIQEEFNNFKIQSRLYRFSNAFDTFFDNMKFYGIKEGGEEENEKRIKFSKFGNKIDIDDLSTGEKQVVFRGAHLLKNCKSIEKGIVLIDEPELSMHPNWQKKILKYYQNLFEENGQQFVQMFIATHSSYVIQAALKDRDDVLVIVLNEENGVVKTNKIISPNVLPSITEAETNYLAFHIPNIDYHIELYGWLQNKYNLASVKSCDDYIVQQQQYNPVNHRILSSHGNTQYQTLPTYVRNAIDHPDNNHSFTEEQLRTSIELLIELCK